MPWRNRMFIDGEWTSAESGEQLEVFDPATDEIVGTVPFGGAVETNAAVDAAVRAFPEWREQTAGERGAILAKVAELMSTNQEELAKIITTESGKPIPESRGEIAYAASFLQWASEEGKRVYGEMVPSSHANKRILVFRQPVGVTAAITPWNFPAAMITRKVGPALAAGCPMIVKPSEQTPLSALFLAKLFQDAELPNGVLNIVTGDPKAIGGALLQRPEVRKLSFTGSTAVGKSLMVSAAPNVVRLSLELGGHAPFIVFEDADIELAVQAAIAAKFRNVGQTCIAPNRFFVHKDVHDQFVAKLVRALERLKIGKGQEDGVQVGPMIDDSGVKKVERHVEDAVKKGAAIRTGGTRQKVDGCADRFFQPTVLTDITSNMVVMQDETFGPVLPIKRFEDERLVIQEANDTPYGLAAYFFTRDASRLLRVAEQLEYGIIGANDGSPSTAQAPFGGVKESGFGREGGRYAMHEYLSVKYVSWRT